VVRKGRCRSRSRYRGGCGESCGASVDKWAELDMDGVVGVVGAVVEGGGGVVVAVVGVIVEYPVNRVGWWGSESGCGCGY